MHLPSLLLLCLITMSFEVMSAELDNTVVGRDSTDYLLPDGSRLQLELWFPATPPETKSNRHKDYAFSAELKQALVEISGMPSMAISTKETSNGFRNVSAKPGTFPLVIFSHGSASFSRQNSRQLEALALAGYIVVAPSHPGESLTTEYADGTIAGIDRSQPALVLMGSNVDKKELAQEIKNVAYHLDQLREKNAADYIRDLPQFVEQTLFRNSVQSAKLRSRHLVQLVNQLNVNDEQINKTALAQADLSKIALYGHSLGGVISVLAAEILNEDKQTIKAVINLDTVQFLSPTEDSLNLSTPTCFIMGGATKMAKTVASNLNLNRPWAEANEAACEINIAKAAHNNFTDLTYVTPLKWFGLLGPIKNKAFGDWLNGFIIAYFNSKLLDETYAYPMWHDAKIISAI